MPDMYNLVYALPFNNGIWYIHNNKTTYIPVILSGYQIQFYLCQLSLNSLNLEFSDLFLNYPMIFPYF